MLNAIRHSVHTCISQTVYVLVLRIDINIPNTSYRHYADRAQFLKFDLTLHQAGGDMDIELRRCQAASGCGDTSRRRFILVDIPTGLSKCHLEVHSPVMRGIICTMQGAREMSGNSESHSDRAGIEIHCIIIAKVDTYIFLYAPFRPIRPRSSLHANKFLAPLYPYAPHVHHLEKQHSAEHHQPNHEVHRQPQHFHHGPSRVISE